MRVLEDGVTNRTLALVTIWITVVLVLQRKQFVDVMQRTQSTLAAPVAARTAALTAANAQLRQEMAERQHLEDQLRHAQKMQALGTQPLAHPPITPAPAADHHAFLAGRSET